MVFGNIYEFKDFLLLFYVNLMHQILVFSHILIETAEGRDGFGTRFIL